MVMGLQGHIRIRTTAPYHVQLQLNETAGPLRVLNKLGWGEEIAVNGNVIRVFRSDGRLSLGDSVVFGLVLCQPGDESDGVLSVYYDAFRQLSLIEAYLFGTPPNCRLAEAITISAPTDEPIMSVTQLERFIPPEESGKSLQRKERWWERIVRR